MTVHVLVVPEKEIYFEELYHDNFIWINADHGQPQLEKRQARYCAPFFLEGSKLGVHRIFHIKDCKLTDSETVYRLELGNSFYVKYNSDFKMGQKVRFEYHTLASFGFAEIKPGLLLDLNHMDLAKC